LTILEFISKDSVTVDALDESESGKALLKYSIRREDGGVRRCSIQFDKLRSWVVLREERDSTRRIDIEYGESVSSIPLAKRLTAWQGGDFKTPYFISVATEIKPGPPPSDVFTLAAFGLPELPGAPKRAFPIWTTLGISGLVVSGALAWLARRRATLKGAPRVTAIRRGAFTLLELLVVNAIVVVLIGLLLPAVQAVRNSAARAKCANNLKQIGLALHGYHDANRSLPAGVTLAVSAEPFPRMTWLVRLLPHLEQESLWQQTVDAFRQDSNALHNPPHVGLATPVLAFSCPSDGRAANAQDTHLGFRAALTNYIGVNGLDQHLRDGVLFAGSAVRFGDISDGTSNSLMVVERPASADSWYGWWYTGVGQRASGTPDYLLGVREMNLGGFYVWFCPSGPDHFRPGRFDDQCDVFHFWSPHAGGANSLFCDGSVHFLVYAADGIMPALATRAGGEAVTLPQ
jgi:prepilin-type processing-associated H-X9-DG protein